MVAAAAETVTVPEAVSVPEKVLLPVKVWVPARIANSLEVFGRLKVRVVPVVIPDSENAAFLGPVDVHFKRMTVAVRAMKAA